MDTTIIGEAIIIGVVIFLACYFIGGANASLKKECDEMLDSLEQKLKEKHQKEMRGEE